MIDAEGDDDSARSPGFSRPILFGYSIDDDDDDCHQVPVLTGATAFSLLRRSVCRALQVQASSLTHSASIPLVFSSQNGAERRLTERKEALDWG